MEEYPQELRTPPVALVSLVGCAELHQTISAALHAEQPPINVLALPDFAKASVLARRQRDPLDPGAGQRAPSGILKRDWLAKHRTRVPAVAAALFSCEQVCGDPSQWLQVCTDLENLKAIVRGRNIRLVVVLVQTSVRDDVSEDLLIALRKRAEIDSKHLVMFAQSNATEQRQSLKRLVGIFAELCSTYYREEGRKIKFRIEKKSFNYVELNVRYCFKVAVYAEFRRDWAEALRFYEDAYSASHEMIGTSTRLPPIQRLIEIKAVAEQLHFKVSTLLLHGGKIVEAIVWFHKHIAGYERLVGVTEVAFLHWEWFSRQFLVFAELLETSSAAIPIISSPHFGTSDSPLTELEFRPAYYYQLSAKYLKEKKYCLVHSFSTQECSKITSTINGSIESVVPFMFIGQSARLFEEGDTVALLPLSDAEFTSYALAEGKKYQDSYEIIALFRKSMESFNSLKTPRMASYCGSQMAREYFSAEDYGKSKQLFDDVAALYRQEGWVILLWETLGYLRECSWKISSLKDFVEYSLEMAALPIFSNTKSEASEGKTEFGPAGPATLSQREVFQEEVFSLLKGERAITPNDGGFHVNLPQDQPLHLEVDLVSPLRVVFLASVAFHDQSVKPGLSTLITLSIMSQLPCPVEVDQLEIQFNQSTCNFRIINTQGELPTSVSSTEDQDVRIETSSALKLMTNKWLRLTYEIKSGQSGKLECLSVTAKIGPHFMICCRVESPASMEDPPLWKFENRVETFPTKDPGLSFSGQKFIQVEEPEPLVDLVLSGSGPALVGENFVIPVTVISKGHAVSAGELKINLVDARGGGLLMSPRENEPLSSDSHHVELLSISGAVEEDELEINSDNIKKIQQSFGVVSVPNLGVGESWSCKLEIKWHLPKSVMLYVSLGYLPNSVESAYQRVNVHRSLQIEGKTPIIITHRFMTPFRREPLLLSKVKSPHDLDENVSLALNEKSVLIVSARNCSEIPLRLISMSVKSDGDVGCCSVQHNSGTSTDGAFLVPGEEFKQVFSVTAQVDSPSLGVGSVCLKWTRDSKHGQNADSCFITNHKLPDVNVEKPPLVVSLECPPHAVLGVPFSFFVRVQNLTSLLQEIKYLLGDSQNFVFGGPHNDSAFILPKTEHIIGYKFVPLSSGSQHLPRITITAVRYSAALQPSIAATNIFVFPSEPNLSINGRRKESIE